MAREVPPLAERTRPHLHKCDRRAGAFHSLDYALVSSHAR